MDLDSLLNNINQDINRQIDEMMNGKVEEPTEPTEETPQGETIFCPECGTQMPADARFCPNCGCNMEEALAANDDEEEGEDYYDEDEDDDATKRQMVLIYNATALAEKYHTDADSVEWMMSEISGILNDEDIEVAMTNAEPGEDYTFDENYCAQRIRECVDSAGFERGPQLSVMIIGGNDCIPMPRIENPANDGGEDLYSDLLYCFEELPDGFAEGEADFTLDFNDALFNVGRLPLETGEMESEMYCDIQDYFEKALMYVKGISVKNIVMTSTASWIPASTAMVDKLPLINMRNVPDEAKRNGMFVSPAVDVEDEEIADCYSDAISNADMLLFNLHGSDEEGSSGYFGQEGYSYPVAITPDTVCNSSVKILNTVACFGARYVNYSRDDSMLLSTIHNSDVVLFAGSCTTAFGRSGCEEFENMIAPTAFSETFMKLYVLYQLKGIPAGEAFLKAKCDYFNYFVKSEEQNVCLATILMFNLYGMPTLNVKPRTDVIERVNGNKEAMIGKGTPKAVKMRISKPERKVVMQKEESSAGGLLAEIRGLVDANLRAIRTVVEQNVYQQLGIPPRDLQSIESYTEKHEGKHLSGYYFNYDQSQGPVKTKTIVKTNANGKLIDAIHTK